MKNDEDKMGRSVEMLDDNCCDVALHQIPSVSDWWFGAYLEVSRSRCRVLDGVSKPVAWKLAHDHVESL